MDPMLLCGAAVCAATAYLNVLPPPQYDKPYTGGITITRASSPDDVRKMCNHTIATNPLGLACAHTNTPLAGRCWIVVAPEKDIIAAGFTAKIVLRHEQAHCAGWPATHPGMRPAMKDER